MALQLIAPSPDRLPAYVDALERGWSPNTLNVERGAEEELAKIATDPAAYLASLEDREGAGEPVVLPDGSRVQRLPWFRRWLWDDDGFCGVISLRWQHGTEALPPHCLGHVGYAVVPWRRGRGYARQALVALLPDAWQLGLRHIDITTDLDNLASQRTALGAGATLLEQFIRPAAFGSSPGLRYRIHRA